MTWTQARTVVQSLWLLASCNIGLDGCSGKKLWINWVPCRLEAFWFSVQCTCMHHHKNIPVLEKNFLRGIMSSSLNSSSSTHVWNISEVWTTPSSCRDASCVSLTDKVRPWSKARAKGWDVARAALNDFFCSAAFDRSIDMSSRWSNSPFGRSVPFCCRVLLTGFFERERESHIAIHSDYKEADIFLSWSFESSKQCRLACDWSEARASCSMLFRPDLSGCQFQACLPLQRYNFKTTILLPSSYASGFASTN